MAFVRKYCQKRMLWGLIMAVMVLLRNDHFALQVAAISTDQDVCEKDGAGQCPNTGSIDPLKVVDVNRRLTPLDLPPPKIFEDFDSKRSVSIADRDLTALHGSILQTGHSTVNHNVTEKNSEGSSELVVIPGLIPREVVAEILTLLRGDENADKAGGRTTIALDKDPDSVDGMTSQEIFLDNDNLREGRPSKGGQSENLEERKELRDKLKKLTNKYAYDILMPFLKEWYGTEKCGRTGRNCTPCYSLIRRYRAGERQSHAPHNDAHSFITVVVSLSDYGNEYNGGLYVSTKSSERNYVKLNR